MFIRTPESLLSEVKWTSYGLQVESGTVTLVTEWYFEIRLSYQLICLIHIIFFSFLFLFMFLASVSFHMTFWSCRRHWDHTVGTMVWTVTASADHHKQFTFGSSLASFIWWPVWLKLPKRVHAVQYDLSQIVLDSGVFHKNIPTPLWAPWCADNTNLSMALKWILDHNDYLI